MGMVTNSKVRIKTQESDAEWPDRWRKYHCSEAVVTNSKQMTYAQLLENLSSGQPAQGAAPAGFRVFLLTVVMFRILLYHICKDQRCFGRLRAVLWER